MATKNNSLYLSLDDPKANSYSTYQAGFLGLWMTLNQLEQRPENPINWDLSEEEKTIKLHFHENPRIGINWLLENSLKINEEGWITPIIWKDIHPQNQVTNHLAIVNTFYQHNSSRKTGSSKQISINIGDEDAKLNLTYPVVESYKAQDYGNEIVDGMEESREVELRGWLNPGGIVNHAMCPKTTCITARPEITLALIYAPFACSYYTIKSEIEGEKMLYAVVIPKIENIKDSSELQKKIWQEPKEVWASNLYDAGFKYFQSQRQFNPEPPIKECKIISYGSMPWAKPQKVRTNSILMTYNKEQQGKFEEYASLLPDYFIASKGKTENSFVKCSFAREIVVTTLMGEKPWYNELVKIANRKEEWENLTNYNKKGLIDMLEKLEGIEVLFVKACHEAIKYVGRNQDTIVIYRLKRCRSAQKFQDFLMKFWTNGKKMPTLQEHWEELMDFALKNENWVKCQNLALLAFATYNRKEYTSN